MNIKSKLLKKISICLLSVITFTSIDVPISSDSYAYNSWQTDVTTMPTVLEYSPSVGYDNKIYYIGGYDRNTDSASGAVQIYDTITNTWSYGESMPTPRYLTSAVTYNDKIYCFGGTSIGGAGELNSVHLNKLEIYDIKSNKWTTGANMPVAREKFCAEVYKGKVYIIGGSSGRNPINYFNTMQVYNISTNSWEADIPMNGLYRHAFTSEIYEDKLYMFSGNYNAPGVSQPDNNDLNIYDFTKKTWSKGPSSSIVRHGLSSILHGDDIYLIGGRGQYQNRKEVEIYNVKTNTWRTGTSAPVDLHWGHAVSVNGYIYCVLGERTNGVVSRYRLDPFPKSSSNIDVYIKPQSILSLSLNTNFINFDNIDLASDITMNNIIELSISSSLPYQVTSTLATDIANKDKTNIITPSILSIKANSSSEYKTFNRVGEAITLLSNQPPTSLCTTGIDLRLNSGVPFKTDVYKSVIKIELNQI